MIGTGRAHVSEVCELARSNLRDGLSAEALVAIGSLGSEGVHEANQERDLHKWLHSLFGMKLTPYTVKMNLTVSQINSFSTPPKMCSSRFTIIFPQWTVLLTAQVFGKKQSPVDVPFLLPHEIVHALHCAGQLQVTLMPKRGIGWKVMF